MEDFVQFIEKFDTVFKLALLLVIIASVWLYFYRKSGSVYSIHDRLWSLFVGKKAFFNARLDAFHKDRHDIDKFNSVYNVSAINTGEIERFTRWIEEEKIDTRKISAIKGWFDISSLKPRKPAVSMTVLIFLLIFAFILSGLTFGLIGLSPNAVVKLDDSDPWFVINHSRAKPVFGDLSITKENCENPDFNRVNYSRRSEITLASVKGICQSFTDAKESDAVDQIIKTQRILFYLGLYSIALGFYALKCTLRRLNAIDFYRLYQKTIKT